MQGIRAMLSRRYRLALATTTLAVFGFAGAASAATYTVNDTTDAPLATPSDTNCVSTNNGSCTLRAAVQAADNAGGTNTINVPAGTYTLTVASAGADDPATGDLDVLSPNALTITGAGSGSTIVNANDIDRAFAVQNGGSLSLAGMTLENGNPASASSGSQQGGAIYSDGGLTVTNDVVLTGNSSLNGSDEGGAIFADSDPGSTLSLTGAVFNQNTSADEGGAIYDNSPDSATISKSSFHGNLSDAEGGAIYGAGSGGLSVDSTSFDSNTGEYGGALYWDSASDVTVTRSSFTNNMAGWEDGGAVEDVLSSSTTLSQDRFIGNAGGYGGALYLDSATPGVAYTLDGDEFDNNQANYDGGAVDWLKGTLSSSGSSFVNNSGEDGGGIYADTAHALTLVNATLSENTAAFGGGMEIESTPTATMTNDTIAYNTAGGGQGGGIYGPPNVTGGSTVENTIVAENTGGDCGLGGAAATFPTAADAGNNLDSDSSCFGGLGGPNDKTGVNPLLGHAADNGGPVLTDAELAGSPAIDAGSNAGCPSTDARGVSRPQGASCDIGAFEAAAAPLGLSKAGPASADTNSPVNYTITVSDPNGPGPSTGTTVVDQLPAGMTLYGATPSQGSCTSSGSPAKVTCKLGTLNTSSTGSNTSATVQLLVTEANAGSITNTANATNDQGSNVSASATTTFHAPVAPSNATAPTAVTGPATGITKTAVTLNGTVVPGGQPTAYFFQYGTKSSYGKATPIGHTGSAAQAVSAVISGLSQGTTYHFRLVAINDSGQSFGADKTFHTHGTIFLGSLVLDSRVLPVKNGHISARFTCKSSKRCFGLFSVTARVKVKHNQLATIVCTKSRFAKYSIAAHKTKTVSVPVHQVCVAYAQAHGGKLGAKLTTRPRSAQRGLVRLVRVVLK